MSPILKRDVGEHIRQARRLAGTYLGSPPDEDSWTQLDSHDKDAGNAVDDTGNTWSRAGYASGSSARQGIGVDEEISQSEYEYNQPKSWTGATLASDAKGKSRAQYGHLEVEDGDGEKDRLRTRRSDGLGNGDLRDDQDGSEETDEMDENRVDKSMGALKLSFEDESDTSSIRTSRMRGLDYAEGDDDMMAGSSASSTKAKLKDLRNLLLESTPSLLVSLVGLVFTGELLEHLARWRVFRRVDELFILVPMIGNLKGNLEMCLSARLGTSANIGELDHRLTRRALITANMTLLGLQALLIASLAAIISFILGLLTTHRLGDNPLNPQPIGGVLGNGTVVGPDGTVLDAGLAVGEVEWHEGYTRPGWKQLVMVLATGMGSAGISSAVLGCFMCSLVVVSRWAKIDPDNITPPLAACLGDLITLFIMALLGSMLVGAMDTPLPLICVIVMSIAAGWFTQRVMRNRWVKQVAKGGWAPLIGAMLISSGTGMVLDLSVGKYRGFALLAISMTGLTGSIGAIHANRLSTVLHTSLHSPKEHRSRPLGLTALQSSITLFLLAFPCQAGFIVFVHWAGWIDLSLGWAGWASFALTCGISITMAHYMTHFFWSKGLDPDSYTLPIHSALVDFLGQLLLMLAYEISIWEGRDVLVKMDVAPAR